jgi:hypothetical protein
MRTYRQPRLIPVTDAADSCGRSPDELRRWCAVGRLRGERIDGEWYLLEEDLHVAATLEEMNATGGDRAVVSIAYSDTATARLALELLASRFPMRDVGLAHAPMALDGTEMVLVAGSFPVERLADVLEVAHRLGGVIVDRVDAARVARRYGRTGSASEGSRTPRRSSGGDEGPSPP